MLSTRLFLKLFSHNSIAFSFPTTKPSLKRPRHEQTVRVLPRPHRDRHCHSPVKAYSGPEMCNFFFFFKSISTNTLPKTFTLPNYITNYNNWLKKITFQLSSITLPTKISKTRKIKCRYQLNEFIKHYKVT